MLLIVALGSLAIWGNREYQRSHAPTLPRSHAPTLPRSHAPTLPPPVRRPQSAAVVPVVAGNQVVTTYFISGERCENCRKIELLCRQTAERDFATELAGNRVIDTGEPANAHYVADYQLTSKIVILSHRVDGRETEWAAMEKVWDLLDDPAGYRAYLAAPIRKYLGPRVAAAVQFSPPEWFESSPEWFESPPEYFLSPPECFESSPECFLSPPECFTSSPKYFLSPPESLTSPPEYFLSSLECFFLPPER